MNREELIKECKEILKEYAADASKVDTLKETDEISETLGLDSLDLVEMVMALEEKFNISIEENEIANIKNLNDIVSYIENATKQDA